MKPSERLRGCLVLLLSISAAHGEVVSRYYDVGQQVPIGDSRLYYVEITDLPSSAVITNTEAGFDYIAYGVVQNYVSSRFNRVSDPGSAAGVTLVSRGSLPAANPGTFGYVSLATWNGQGANSRYYFRFAVASASPFTATVNRVQVRLTYQLPAAPRVSVTPAIGPRGTTFSQPGSDFTSGGTAELHFRYPDGRESTASETVGGDGRYAHSWASPADALLGVYQYWAKDLASNRTSPTTTFTLTGVIDSARLYGLTSVWPPANQPSTVMQGGTAVRYFRVQDRAGRPAPSGTSVATSP